MIAATDVSHVSKKVATGGGIFCAMERINSSPMGPGPLGILATSPMADAPCCMAVWASSIEAMQQILTWGIEE
jgi:hypothetical protein